MDTLDRAVICSVFIAAVLLSWSLFYRAEGRSDKIDARIESLERDRSEVQRMYSGAVMDALVKSVVVLGSQTNYINQTAESIKAESAFVKEVSP